MEDGLQQAQPPVKNAVGARSRWIGVRAGLRQGVRAMAAAVYVMVLHGVVSGGVGAGPVLSAALEWALLATGAGALALISDGALGWAMLVGPSFVLLDLGLAWLMDPDPAGAFAWGPAAARSGTLLLAAVLGAWGVRRVARRRR